MCNFAASSASSSLCQTVLTYAINDADSIKKGVLGGVTDTASNAAGGVTNTAGNAGKPRLSLNFNSPSLVSAIDPLQLAGLATPLATPPKALQAQLATQPKEQEALCLILLPVLATRRRVQRVQVANRMHRTHWASARSVDQDGHEGYQEGSRVFLQYIAGKLR